MFLPRRRAAAIGLVHVARFELVHSAALEACDAFAQRTAQLQCADANKSNEVAACTGAVNLNLFLLNRWVQLLLIVLASKVSVDGLAQQAGSVATLVAG